jgi:hypothetical protein
VFKTRFCVEGAIPDNAEKSVKIYNTKKNEFKDAKGTLKKGEEEYITYMQFYVKDFSNYLSNSFAKVILCDRETKKSGFFRNIKPLDIIKRKDAKDKV